MPQVVGLVGVGVVGSEFEVDEDPIRRFQSLFSKHILQDPD